MDDSDDLSHFLFSDKKNGLGRADKLKVLRRIKSTLFKMDTFGMGT